MSFILDALRKSEHARQRQTGPTLVEGAVAAPKPKSNTWATAAIALLVVNLVAVGVLLLWKSRDDEPAAAAAPATNPAPGTPAAATAAAAPVPTAQATVTQTLPEPAIVAPPPRRPAVTPAGRGTRHSLEREVSSYAPSMEYEAAVAAAAPPPGPAVEATTQRGSVVYESLPGAGPGTADARAANPSTAVLPTADELTARGGLAEMRLELHVYATRPQDRSVFVNGRRYREGDTTAEGATVVEITPDGAIMTAGGNRFLLTRD
jgi:general secretion pathway protein B